MQEYFIYSMPGRPLGCGGFDITQRLKDLYKQHKKYDPERAEVFRKAANYASNLPKHGNYGLAISERRKTTDPHYLQDNSKREFRKLIVYSFIA